MAHFPTVVRRSRRSGAASTAGEGEAAAGSGTAARDAMKPLVGGRAGDGAVGPSERRRSAEPRRRGMRVTIVTRFFPPEMGAAATRLFQLGKRLAAAGHQVQVLCPLPNYLRDRVFEDYRGRLRVVEQVAGMRIVRTWIYKNGSGAFPRRNHASSAVSSLSFAVSSLLLGAWSLGRQDIVLFNTPPLSLVSVGLLVGRLTRARTVMYAGDMHPDAMLRLGFELPEDLLRHERRRERLGYERSDLVLTTTPSTRSEIKRRFPHVSVEVLPNGADIDLFRPSLRRQSARIALGVDTDGFLVGYFGLHGSEQGLEAVVDAAALADGSKMRFVMAGEGTSKAALVERARRLGIGNTRFLDVLPRSEVAALLASCDAVLVPLARDGPDRHHAFQGLRDPGLRRALGCQRRLRRGGPGPRLRCRSRLQARRRLRPGPCSCRPGSLSAGARAYPAQLPGSGSAFRSRRSCRPSRDDLSRPDREPMNAAPPLPWMPALGHGVRRKGARPPGRSAVDRRRIAGPPRRGRLRRPARHHRPDRLLRRHRSASGGAVAGRTPPEDPRTSRCAPCPRTGGRNGGNGKIGSRGFRQRREQPEHALTQPSGCPTNRGHPTSRTEFSK